MPRRRLRRNFSDSIKAITWIVPSGRPTSNPRTITLSRVIANAETRSPEVSFAWVQSTDHPIILGNTNSSEYDPYVGSVADEIRKMWLTLRSIVSALWRLRSRTKRKGACAVHRFEQLESRCMLAADVIDFGSDVDVVEVGRRDDGAIVVVGTRAQQFGGRAEGVVFTIDSDYSSFTEDVVKVSAGDTHLTGLSPNGQYISGYANDAQDKPFGGFRFNSENTQVRHSTGAIGELATSSAIDVANDGMVVGTTEGPRIPFEWNASVGATTLADSVGTTVQATSELGVTVGYLTGDDGTNRATRWEQGSQVFLETPNGFDSKSHSISADGENVGGSISIVGEAVNDSFSQAVVWEQGKLRYLEGPIGVPFEGRVRSVSDNGYAVGDSDQGGFIWHEDFEGVRMFDEWLRMEFQTALPGPTSSVNDVLFDGDNLLFAISGGVDFVATQLFDRRSFPFLNEEAPSDVSGDAKTSPIDPLLVINELNRAGSYRLPAVRRFNELFLDTNGDGYLAPVDVLVPINRLNNKSNGSQGSDDAPNETPVAEDDVYFMAEDTTLHVLGDGVLGNDHDAESDSFVAVQIRRALHGDVLLNTNGSFTYQPDANFFGTDSFTYVASQNGRYSYTATVTITVASVNDAPVAEDAVFPVASGGKWSDIVPYYDFDYLVDSPGLSATIVDGPMHGMMGWRSNGIFHFRPDPGFVGVDNFTYHVTDGHLSDTATITFNVQPAVAEFSFGVFDFSGNPVDNARVGDELRLVTYVKDARPNATGVSSAYLDVWFDPSAVALTGESVFGGQITGSTSGSTGVQGRISSVGARRLNPSTTGGTIQQLFSISFTVLQPGELIFEGLFDRDHDLLLLGSSDVIDPGLLLFHSFTLRVE